MSHVGSNIKKIRMVRKMSQAEFAALFALARPSIGAYEEGRAEPKIDTIIKIAAHFKLSIDLLITRELTVTDLMSFGNFKQKLDAAHLWGGKKLKELKQEHPPVKYVPAVKHLEYVVSHKNHDFLAGLEELKLPLKTTGAFRAFEVNGSELEHQQHGIHHGDIVTGRLCEISSLKTGELCILVTTDTLIIRWLKILDNKTFSLDATNMNYPTITVESESVLECWKVTGLFTPRVSLPRPLEEKVLLLEQRLEELNRKVNG